MEHENASRAGSREARSDVKPPPAPAQLVWAAIGDFDYRREQLGGRQQRGRRIPRRNWRPQSNGATGRAGLSRRSRARIWITARLSDPLLSFRDGTRAAGNSRWSSFGSSSHADVQWRDRNLRSRLNPGSKGGWLKGNLSLASPGPEQSPHQDELPQVVGVVVGDEQCLTKDGLPAAPGDAGE